RGRRFCGPIFGARDTLIVMLSAARSLLVVLSALALAACGRAGRQPTGSPPGSSGAAAGASGSDGSAGTGVAGQDAGLDADARIHADVGDAVDAATGGFVHPGCLSTQADLDRMKAKVAAAAQPW